MICLPVLLESEEHKYHMKQQMKNLLLSDRDKCRDRKPSVEVDENGFLKKDSEDASLCGIPFDIKR
jgi:hypothetical protein